MVQLVVGESRDFQLAGEGVRVAIQDAAIVTATPTEGAVKLEALREGETVLVLLDATNAETRYRVVVSAEAGPSSDPAGPARDRVAGLTMPSDDRAPASSTPRASRKRPSLTLPAVVLGSVVGAATLAIVVVRSRKPDDEPDWD